MKRIMTLALVAMALVIFSGCGDKDTSSTSRSRHESVLTEQTLVEDIIVEGINVEEIQVNEITWEDSCTYWDDV